MSQQQKHFRILNHIWENSTTEAKESYNNGKEAGIDYKIEIINKDNTKKEFSSAYTLKKRANGWKLIHPYGENIDTT